VFGEPGQGLPAGRRRASTAGETVPRKHTSRAERDSLNGRDMAKSNNKSSFWNELGRFNIYKRNQGRLTRQLTWLGFALLVFFGAYTLSQGPLSGFVRSYFGVQVKYPADTANERIDGEVQSVLDAEYSSWRWAGARFEAGRRVIDVRLTTSQGGSTVSELQGKANVSVAPLCDRIKASLPEVEAMSTGHHTEQIEWIRLGIPFLLAVAGGWVLFRLVNYPRFADFLISVEAEMDKVSWPRKAELKRATAVVLSTMLFLGFVLFAYDWIWVKIFSMLGILQLPES
jgi:preprotein translocase SecE subunit